jgi:hypothetical protein
MPFLALATGALSRPLAHVSLLQDYGTIPKGVVELSLDNFKRELRSLRRAVRYNELAEVAQDARQAGSSPGLLGRVGFAAGQAVRRWVCLTGTPWLGWCLGRQGFALHSVDASTVGQGSLYSCHSYASAACLLGWTYGWSSAMC